MRKAGFRTSAAKIVGLMKVATGQAPADLAVIDADVVNVYTEEILKRQNILVSGDTIAYVGNDCPAGAIGPETKVIRAENKTVIPGLIDGHTHADDLYLPSELARFALKGGTTTIITETSAIGAALGYPGVLGFMQACRRQPVRFLFTAPPIICVSRSAEELAPLTPAQMARLLNREDVVALGEVSWAQANADNPRLLEVMAQALNAGRPVDGHAAGARNAKLQAFFATGVSSCHEPTTADEALERLRLGVFVPVREGAVRRELREVAKVKGAGVSLELLAVASDGVSPGQLLNGGYLDALVRQAVSYGIAPVTAVKMASLNVAKHFGLDFLGGIAPGKLADMVVIPGLDDIRAEDVIMGGRVMVTGGRLTVDIPKSKFPNTFYNTIHLDRDYRAPDFAIPVSGSPG